MYHLSVKYLQHFLMVAVASSITMVSSVGSQKTPKCNSSNTSDFRFADITPSSANISWIEPSADLAKNTSSILRYIVSYRGNYRHLYDVGGEKNVSLNEPTWFEVTDLSPWPTQYSVCLQIEYAEDGNITKVDGQHGCAVLCTKLNHLDYFAIAAMGSAGMILLSLLLSFICGKDVYSMSTDDVVEMTRIKKIEVKERKHRRVGYTDVVQ